MMMKFVSFATRVPGLNHLCSPPDLRVELVVHLKVSHVAALAELDEEVGVAEEVRECRRREEGREEERERERENTNVGTIAFYY